MHTISSRISVTGKTFADRLRQARRRRGLSQSELARLIGAPPSSIGNLEQGLSKTSRKLVQIAEALGVRPEWLASGAQPVEPGAEISAATLQLARQIEQLSALQPSESTIALARRIEKLSPPQLSAVRAMIEAFTDVAPAKVDTTAFR